MSIKKDVASTLLMEQGKKKENEMIRLEKAFVDYTIDDLKDNFEQKMLEFANELQEFKKKHFDDTKKRIKGSSSLVVSDYFFKPFSAYCMGSKPKYEYEKLLVAFEYYREIVNKINMDLYQFYPTLSHFCRFLGLSVATWKADYTNNRDSRVSELVQVVEDWIFDTNMRLSEGHEIDNVTSIFRNKVELNKIEQQVPQTVIVANNTSIEEIKDRLKAWTNFDNEKKVIEYNENE